jgi:hypothetical protein
VDKGDVRLSHIDLPLFVDQRFHMIQPNTNMQGMKKRKAEVWLGTRSI